MSFKYFSFLPAKPKKCCTKNVKFTPKNINQKWILPQASGYLNPVNLAPQ